MKKIKKIFNWLKFILGSIKIFGEESPEFVLKIIELFVTLETPFYKDTLYLGRSTKKSSILLKNLIESYFETKSKVTLNQIMTVLKEEIIEREQKNGREQFSSRSFRRSDS